MNVSRRRNRSRGTTLIFVVGILGIMGFLGESLMFQAVSKYRQSDRLRARVVLGQMCDGGAARARAEMAASPEWTGADRLALGRGEVRLRVLSSGDRTRLVVTAAIPSLDDPQWTETRTLSLAPREDTP